MKQTILTAIFVSLFMFIFASKTFAATLSLDPATQSVPLNQTFVVKLLIDTEGEATTSYDAIMKYDNSILAVQSVEYGDYGSNPFYEESSHRVDPDNFYITASVKDPIDTRTGTGTVATITFKGIAVGTSDVTFDCTPGRTSDTNISKNDKNSTDIVVCDALTNGRYTVGTGIVNPAPTTAPPVYYTPTPAPTMPVGGTVETTMGIAGIGILLMGIGLGSRILMKA